VLVSARVHAYRAALAAPQFAKRHPVVASAERGERWLYCYTDEVFAEY